MRRTGCMTELMKGRAVPVDGLEVRLRRRHLHIIVHRHIEGTLATDAKVDSCGSDQRLDLGLDQAWFRGRHRGHEVLGQTFTLRKVEDGESFEEIDGVGFFAGLLRSLLLVIGDKAVGIDDRGAALALEDMAAEARQCYDIRRPDGVFEERCGSRSTCRPLMTGG
jgi:hypothetical protein